ncbi:MAG TPA: hypothetical protein VMO26_08305 [Vicinamibacterales bacterium]|nr:hypothetical protein [Vicinamibacterales bacterium]
MPSRQDLHWRVAASLIVALVVGLTIRYNTFAPWATDSGAYVAAGHQWATGELFFPAEFTFGSPWGAEPLVEAPYGYVQGPTKGTLTGGYPLGYPLLIAAAIKLGGPLAAYAVAPVMAGVLAWCAFLLGSYLSTPMAGTLAALMIAATPVTFHHVVFPMSDVPAAAFWALAWVMSLRPGMGAATAAGAATAFAVMIRPNLAPLALVIAASLAAGERLAFADVLKRVVAFGIVASIGPLLVLWSQAMLYGHPLQSGYRMPLDFFYNTERIPHNARLYPSLLYQVHSGIAFAGLLFVPLAIERARLGPAHYRAAVVTAGAVGVVAVNYALFLPYLSFEGPEWLRFMLPAMLALFLLLAGALDQLRFWLIRRWRWAGVLVLLPALYVVVLPHRGLQPPVGFLRLQSMGRYLRAALPDNAVILTFTHGAALRHATGRPVLRLDGIAPESLEAVIADLQRRGHRPVYVLDVAVEGGYFSDKFRASELSRLIWPARAEFTSATSVLYYDLQDRDAFLNGDRWTTDVLLEPPTALHPIDWPGHRVEHERVLFPVETEVLAFRSMLETTYATILGRAPEPILVPPRDALRWTQRYLRYRVHGCSHVTAMANVVGQLEGGGIAPLCALPDAVQFPPWNETVELRRALDEKVRHSSRANQTSAVDLEGEAVWLQQYLELRVGKCSHQDASRAVIDRIVSGTPAACQAQ